MDTNTFTQMSGSISVNARSSIRDSTIDLNLAHASRKASSGIKIFKFALTMYLGDCSVRLGGLQYTRYLDGKDLPWRSQLAERCSALRREET